MSNHRYHKNVTLHESCHLLAEMRARIREINSTAIRKYFIVVWLIFCFLLFTAVLDVFHVLLILYSLSYGLCR
jgi:hypothetical protein